MIVDELEKKLRPPDMGLAPYPAKVITLASGEKMVCRESRHIPMIRARHSKYRIYLSP